MCSVTETSLNLQVIHTEVNQALKLLKINIVQEKQAINQTHLFTIFIVLPMAKPQMTPPLRQPIYLFLVRTWGVAPKNYY